MKSRDGGLKNCIVIHGCPDNVEERVNEMHWTTWLKRNLIARGIKTETPLMPESWKPNYEKFKEEFEKLLIDENTILVGHSCGCAFLVRWLGESKIKIAKLILVAPWKIYDKSNKQRKVFYDYPINETIKSRVEEVIMFTADDEEEEGKDSLKIFHEALKGKVIELGGRGHYTLGDMGTEEFPELLEAVLK